MLTYNLPAIKGPLYKQLYDCIKEDIVTGKIESGIKLPSKRAFAKNLGVSTITVENAYDQLASEGYIYSIPKSGYYVSDISGIKNIKIVGRVAKEINLPTNNQGEKYDFDFSSNRVESANFPFSVWAKIMREVISIREKELLNISPYNGVYELRMAIANHLASFRGMMVDPNQIIIGAGTEYLYGMLVKLLGEDKIFCVENPGYKKLHRIYESSGVTCRFARLDQDGIRIDELEAAKADIVHISPTHHFPTGITMPVKRRYELLTWANAESGRYIIEDDYDSEFRINGKPIPSLQSIDASDKVIYMNTFSKSITSTIRISYMILPEKLAKLYYEKLSYYSCTVSTFEQYALSEFISKGYFEKHINRMRLYYGKKRKIVLGIIRTTLDENQYRIIENDSGLHFILEIKTDFSDNEIKEKMLQSRIKIDSITEYEVEDLYNNSHRFIINYSGMDTDNLEAALIKLKKIIS